MHKVSLSLFKLNVPLTCNHHSNPHVSRKVCRFINQLCTNIVKPTLACELHSCLNKHTYEPEKCKDSIRKLYQCCQKMYETSPQSESTACPMPKVVDKWLKAHPEISQ